MTQAKIPRLASEPQPLPKTLTQQKADFTAEGAPAIEPALPDTPKPTSPKKTLPLTPPPHAGALGRPLSGAHWRWQR